MFRGPGAGLHLVTTHAYVDIARLFGVQGVSCFNSFLVRSYTLTSYSLSIMADLDVIKARSNFPALASGYIFADNAGGSQAAKSVIDKIVDYLLNTNVQLGADYSVSVTSTQRTMSEGPAAAARLVNAKSPNEIVFSASSTMNLENLARGLENDIQAGDEFIVTGEHEGLSESSIRL